MLLETFKEQTSLMTIVNYDHNIFIVQAQGDQKIWKNHPIFQKIAQKVSKARRPKDLQQSSIW